MHVYAEDDTLWLQCDGCGEKRQVPPRSLRVFHTYVNRFKREHTWRCEVRAQMERDYDKAGRTAAKLIGKFVRKTT